MSRNTKDARSPPADNGYLSDAHAEKYNENKQAKNKLKEYPGLKRKPLKATGHPVTQKWYADQGIITPEMEYIAIRENMGRKQEFKTICDHYPNLKDLPEDASERLKHCSSELHPRRLRDASPVRD